MSSRERIRRYAAELPYRLLDLAAACGVPLPLLRTVRTEALGIHALEILAHELGRTTIRRWPGLDTLRRPRRNRAILTDYCKRPPPPLVEIAARHGVSPRTVVRVLKHTPRAMSSDVQRISRAVERLTRHVRDVLEAAAGGSFGEEAEALHAALRDRILVDLTQHFAGRCVYWPGVPTLRREALDAQLYAASLGTEDEELAARLGTDVKAIRRRIARHGTSVAIDPGERGVAHHATLPLTTPVAK